MNTFVPHDFDIETWKEFCKRSGANPKFDEREANFARDIHSSTGYTGKKLNLAVRHKKETQRLHLRHLVEMSELDTLEKLERKHA